MDNRQLAGIVAVIIIVAGAAWYFGGGAGGGGGTTPAAAANYGDTVSVDYTLRVDGKVVDTSVSSVAQQAGIYAAGMKYEPLRFPVLLGQGLIPGFVNGVVGMKEGEARNITVGPASGYGTRDESKISNISLRYNRSVYEEVPTDLLVQAGLNATEGVVIPTKQGMVAIWNVTGSITTLRYIFNQGAAFTMYGLPQVVESVDNDTAYIRFDVKENQTYYVEDREAGTVHQAMVTQVGNGTFTLDENHPLAGKTLVFEITLRALTKGNATAS